MLTKASFSNFTSVPGGEWIFSPGINIIIGENGLGKSHVLKAIYSVLNSLSPDAMPLEKVESEGLRKGYLEKKIADELSANMRPDSLGRLVKRRQGRNRADVSINFMDSSLDVKFSFASNSKTSVEISQNPSGIIQMSPVFIPTRELITLCPWFISLYDTYQVPFEKTWRDTVLLLGAPSIRGPRESNVSQALSPIEEAMGGKVEVDANGRFFLKVRGGKMEAALVAEGLRKFAMLARLISTGVLLDHGYLFWDEPETNLNPKLIKSLAEVIYILSEQGVQIFIATHSTFLIREMAILTEGKDNRSTPRYFALSASGDEEVSGLEQGDRIDDLETLVLLDEELLQSDRFMEKMNNE